MPQHRLQRNSASPKRSVLVNRAPCANSAAETFLRPSTLTAARRNTVVLPQVTYKSFPSDNNAPGGFCFPRESAAATNVLDTGSPQTWQVLPRKDVLAPGQGAKPRLRLKISLDGRLQLMRPSSFFSIGDELAFGLSFARA